jgi:hypothetical protein
MLTNAVDGWAHLWLDGLVHILQSFSRHGAPARKVKDWTGRWWSLWGAVDLVPMGEKVLVAGPGISELWLSGTRLVPEDALATEMTARYDRAAAPPTSRRRGKTARRSRSER